MDTEKLQLLLDNELSGKKRADFIIGEYDLSWYD